MSNSKEDAATADAENLCVVCCKTVEIYSVGVCDHPVCFECSTRMRVLCSQNECPICRGQMPKVIFTWDVAPFAQLHPKFEKSEYQDRKYGLIFCSSEIQQAYQQLREYRCLVCSNKNGGRKYVYLNFSQLRDHMRREHGLAYCELCVDNLKIFCFERRCYTKQELGTHRRKGDPDNTSHRGHPLCEFCDTRFMDSDELFRHLRRNHLFCHFCDADGKHQYYNTMDDLKKHYRDEHHLCEEGECRNMPLTAVFKTNLDLKAHIAMEHSRNMSKLASKQARTVELEFTLTPRPRPDRNKRPPHPVSRSDEEGATAYNFYEPAPIKQVNTLTPQDFPALGNSSTVTVQSRPMSSVNFTSKVAPFSGNDFPSLGGSRSAALTITTNSASVKKKPPEVTITRTTRSGQQNLSRTSQNFPRLGGATSGTSTVRVSVNNNGQVSAPKVSIHVNHNGGITSTHIATTASSSSSAAEFDVHQKPAEAFPALGKTSAPIQPHWVQQKPKKQEARLAKVAPAPQLPPSDLAQFPSLNKTKSEKKKSSSVTVPLSNSWVNAGAKQTNGKSKSTNEGVTKNGESKVENVEVKTKNKKQKKKNNEVEAQMAESTARNGIVKKRSELNIGALTPTETEAKQPPPPGFPAKPPPGFTNGHFPSLSNDLTFTNSSGQSFSIKPTGYHQPANFAQRNQNLIKRFVNLVDSASVKEFKCFSELFRQGSMPAERYYEHCRAIMGSSFNEVFPELLVLLPDIAKQQELYRVYDGGQKNNLLVCENCKQVIFKRELGEHYNYHSLDSHFPSLGREVDGNNAWKK